ncbi:MAG: coproporphyrinogen III oxidase family protein [Deltaproteobacteria bacterium]|nr:coproporphyrinogen III oxidase family protein [Deltaproteobacteria bacterium]
MIETILSAAAKKEFSRAIRFDQGREPSLPPGDGKPDRLLYVHIPFCEALCPYCSFNRVLFDESLCRRYFEALGREMGLYREAGYDFGGLYVGGGTPTVMIDELEKLLLRARDTFSIREISVETNPNHLTDRHVAALQRAGIQRLSVGVQSFDDTLLRVMGRDRYGGGDEIAGRLAEMEGRFQTLNVDMMFNMPSQTADILEKDLAVLLKTGPAQITYYPLMVSDSTRRRVEHTLGRVDYGRERRYYSRISERLGERYRFASAWCFSREEAMIDEYIVDYDEYAGLGSGSIGYMHGICYANTFSIPAYIETVEKGRIPLMASRSFSMRDRARYDFVMKLFGLELDLQSLKEKYGTALYRLLWSDIAAFVLAGGLSYDDGRLHCTARGRYFWVIMMREFFTAVNNFRDFCMNRMP